MGEEIEVLEGGRSLEEARKNEADLQTEAQIVDKLRESAKEAGIVKSSLLERVAAITDKNLLPQALRAATDAEAKSIEGLIKLTGRDGQEAADDFTSMLRHMAEAGFLKLNVSLEAGPRSPDD